MPVLDVHKQSWGTLYWFYCPGCKGGHGFSVCNDGSRPSWSFDGNLERPTFSPSLLVNCSSRANIEVGQWMPVMLGYGGKRADVRVPFAMLSERRAQRNHDQSLGRLRQRGGMSAGEILCNLDDVGLHERPCGDPVLELAEVESRVKAYLDRLPPAVCHSFVRDGQIEFLGDCTHSLAGQTVPLPSVDFDEAK